MAVLTTTELDFLQEALVPPLTFNLDLVHRRLASTSALSRV
jgi:hypothetical protein